MDAKRLHTAHLTFTALEWKAIEAELENFLQPTQKLENIEFVYDELPVKTKNEIVATPATDE